MDSSDLSFWTSLAEIAFDNPVLMIEENQLSWMKILSRKHRTNAGNNLILLSAIRDIVNFNRVGISQQPFRTRITENRSDQRIRNRVVRKVMGIGCCLDKDHELMSIGIVGHAPNAHRGGIKNHWIKR